MTKADRLLKPDLPPAVARAFVKDMLAYFAEKNAIKRDEIAGRQIHVLREYQRKNEGPIKLHDVKEMFMQMKDQI